MDGKKMCTSCFHLLPPEAFIYKNKPYKTCSACLTAKSNKRVERNALPINNQLESMNNQIENQLENEIETITFTNIIEHISNKVSSLEQDKKFYFNLCVKIDDDILAKVNHDMRLLFNDFKKDWNQSATNQISDSDNTRYFIDPECWICSCPPFLYSRFLICKHLVQHAVNNVVLLDSQGIRLLYENFKRQEDYPFLIWSINGKLTQKDFNIKQFTISQVNIQSSLISQNSSLVKMDQDEPFDPEMCWTCEQKVAAIKSMATHLKQELLANNLNHVTQVVNNIDKLFNMLKDIEIAQNKRKRDPTWHGSTPWTFFLP
ncbi:21501_t:CDS:2 [Cetraspora pellucida]|uniref:21501_t:CDS:1 n=1 Tax=Cetraspora pellucida TaxID=1433469 RepID=A0A9N9IR38_9GLOM|nr:21501_t:CDS:2 [Cetraspora pellucida]